MPINWGMARFHNSCHGTLYDHLKINYIPSENSQNTDYHSYIEQRLKQKQKNLYVFEYLMNIYLCTIIGV